MESGYRRGVLIVVLTIVVSGGLCLASMIVSGASRATAAQDLGAGAVPIGSFSLKERSGETVTEETLRDRAWIASFIFTRCKLSCPRITSIMKSLQDRLAGTDVQLVSISVDPEYDTPEVLDRYAQSFGADPHRWWFLTGDRDAIMAMIHDKFLLPAMANPSPSPDGDDEAVIHSDRLALVDHGKVVGLFDTHDPQQIEEIVARARRSSLPSWVRTLPAVNATLNGHCTILLLVALAGVSLADHHKKVLWRAAAVSIVMLLVGGLVGAIPF